MAYVKNLTAERGVSSMIPKKSAETVGKKVAKNAALQILAISAKLALLTTSENAHPAWLTATSVKTLKPVKNVRIILK
jgi:hypothetical protein